jgi:hypothetical protein
VRFVVSTLGLVMGPMVTLMVEPLAIMLLVPVELMLIVLSEVFGVQFIARVTLPAEITQ